MNIFKLNTIVSFGLLSSFLCHGEESLVLEPIVITATRTEKRDIEIPQSLSYYTEDDFRTQKTPRSIPELLKEEPGILVQKTAHGHGSPYIRGFTAFRNLFLIDGVKLNNSIFREGPNQYWNTVDSMMVSEMELVKGPSSTLYGSDSVGGTLQIKTHERSYDELDYDWEKQIFTRFSSAESSYLSRLDFEGTLGKKLGISVGGTLKNFGDLEAGSPTGEQPSTGYDEYSQDLKLSYYFDRDSSLVFAFQNHQQNDVPRTHKTIHGKSFEGTTIGSEFLRETDQKRRLSYLKYHHKNLDKNFADQFEMNLSYHEQSEERLRERPSGASRRRDIQSIDVGTVGLSFQLEKDSDFGNFVYGGELYHDEVDSSKQEWDLTTNTQRGPFIQGQVGDDASYDSFGLFIQNDYALTDQLNLLSGIRWTRNELEANAVEDPQTGNQISISDESQAVVGSLRLAYQLNNNWLYYTGVSQSFRSPNLSDLTRLDTARSNEIETPVPGGLDPERFLTSEIGFKVTKPFVYGGVNYYYTQVKDMIIRTPTGQFIGTDAEVTKKNSGEGYINGIELDIGTSLTSELSVELKTAWHYGEIETFASSSATSLQSDYMSRMLPWTSLIKLRYEKADKPWWLESLLTIASKQDKLSLRDQGDTQRIPPGGTPGYEVFTLRGGYRVNEGVSLTITIENLTDENYRVHGSGLNEAGLNGIFGVGIRI